MDNHISLSKTCTYCGEVKLATLAFFAAHPAGKYGLQARCRACYNAISRQAKQSNPEKTRLYRAEMNVRHREKRIAYNKAWNVSEKGREGIKRRRAGVQDKARRGAAQKLYDALPENKARKAQREKECRALPENKEKVRVRAQRRRKTIRDTGSTFTLADVQKKRLDQNDLCYWCQKPIVDKYNIDHIIPLSKGGDHSAGNICISHPSCNFKKASMMPWEYNGRLF